MASVEGGAVDVRDRLAGVLVGTAIGDALGLPMEGMRAASIARSFPKLDRYFLFGRTGFVSDDTEQSALVAQSLAGNPAVARIGDRIDSSNIAASLVAKTFTIPELRHVHAILAGKPQDPGNFRRKFERLLEDGVIEEAPGKRITVSKPATVYHFVTRIKAGGRQ